MAQTAIQRAIRDRLNRLPSTSKRSLAAEIGVKPDTLIGWERGRTPREYQLVRMAAALGTTVDELRGDSGVVDSAALPADVAATLRKLAELADVVPALKEIGHKAPDLIKILEDARNRASEFKL